MKYYTGNNTGDVPGNLPDPYYCKQPKRNSTETSFADTSQGGRRAPCSEP